MDENRQYFAKRKPVKCPACGARKVVWIAYGYPGEEMIASVKKGKIVLGGCIVSELNPSWQCTSCNAAIYHDEVKAIGARERDRV